MTTLQAIETRYKGYRFRSRLEARWAVVFDHLGVSWRYEVQGYELPSGERYLPDFELTFTNFGPPVCAEVKGDLNTADWDRLWKFAQYRLLLILSDIPEPEPGWGSAMFPALDNVDGGHVANWLYFGKHGKAFGLPGFLRDGEIPPTAQRVPLEDERVSAAFTAGREARFEHGETPA